MSKKLALVDDSVRGIMLEILRTELPDEDVIASIVNRTQTIINGMLDEDVEIFPLMSVRELRQISFFWTSTRLMEIYIGQVQLTLINQLADKQVLNMDGPLLPFIDYSLQQQNNIVRPIIIRILVDKYGYGFPNTAVITEVVGRVNRLPSSDNDDSDASKRYRSNRTARGFH